VRERAVSSLNVDDDEVLCAVYGAARGPDMDKKLADHAWESADVAALLGGGGGAVAEERAFPADASGCIAAEGALQRAHHLALITSTAEYLSSLLEKKRITREIALMRKVCVELPASLCAAPKIKIDGAVVVLAEHPEYPSLSKVAIASPFPGINSH